MNDLIPSGTKQSRLRFVVYKGVEGFGDRVQCLLHVIAYAKITGRILVIDWRDPDWCHQSGQGFGHYFSLREIPTFGINEFMLYYQAFKGELSIEPGAWHYLLESVDHKSLLYKPLLGHDSIGEKIHNVVNLESADFEADVVVYGGTGFRAFKYADFLHLTPSRWLELKLQDFFTSHHLVPGDYDVIHLRGGSKSWAGGKVRRESLASEIEEKFPTQDAYLSFLHQSYEQATTSSAPKMLMLITDMRSLATAWIDKYQCGVLIDDTFNAVLAESGTHEISSSVLSTLSSNVTKERLNYELLRDFTILCNARHCIVDGTSVFSTMALRAKEIGFRFITQ